MKSELDKRLGECCAAAQKVTLNFLEALRGGAEAWRVLAVEVVGSPTREQYGRECRQGFSVLVCVQADPEALHSDPGQGRARVFVSFDPTESGWDQKDRPHLFAG